MNSPASAADTPNTDFVIIGGGIIGLLTAYELVQAGASVTIIDRQSIARESSWAGGGILSPLYPWRYPEPVTRLASWSQQHYPALMQRLSEDSGVDAEYIKSGLLLSAPNEEDIAVKWSEKHEIYLKLIDPEELGVLQPGVIAGHSQWLWMPEIAQVRNPKLLQALRVYLLKTGVKIIENDPIYGFETESGRLTGLRTESGIFTAERCLVAAGAWSGELLAGLGVQIVVEPVRGQMLLLKGSHGFLRRIVLRDSHYLIPRRDGRILVGSTIEHAGFDHSTTAKAKDELVAAAEAIYPGITGSCEIERQWAGLRPGSPEGIPYIGELPNLSGLFVSTGHYRNGFVLAPASARLAADLMLGRRPEISPDVYAPAPPKS